MSNLTLLDDLKKKEQDDNSLPLKDTATNLVFGEGSPTAKVFFLGEAPGKNEDLTGKPFIGQAGKVLDQLLESIGLNREDVFITSVLHYRPPKNRDPKPAEIALFQKYIDSQIDIIKPKVIVTLGRISMNKFLPGAVISVTHGKAYPMEWNGRKIIVIPMYHPAAILYRRDLLKTLTEDFVAIKKALAE